MSRAPSRKQALRVQLTAEQVRLRTARKRLEADRAAWLLIGGTSEWERELVRRRAARNAQTRAANAARRATEAQPEQRTLWGDSDGAA